MGLVPHVKNVKASVLWNKQYEFFTAHYSTLFYCPAIPNTSVGAYVYLDYHV